MTATLRNRFQGCLLGGAVGDALGAPVEFMTREEIVRHFGPNGITDYAPAYGGLGRITDDTQMTLFTAEGLLRGWVRGRFRGITTLAGVTANAYLRWLRTQGEQPSRDIDFDANAAGWLFQHRQLHSRRAPGNTCLSSLKSMESLGQTARNDSKGCGGVMRDGHEETLNAINRAEALATSALEHDIAISQLGQGWVAEEALAISIYCALIAGDFKHGVTMAVNHDGDSDSTGSIVGNLLGAAHGATAIPSDWLDRLELSDVISELAEDLYDFADWDIGEYSANRMLNERIRRKYPGC